MQECCVCFEAATPIYFKCDHWVCVGCASTLYARGGEVPCPMCRAPVQHELLQRAARN
jgi:hypothetical protein